jgi:hypothetical protein
MKNIFKFSLIVVGLAGFILGFHLKSVSAQNPMPNASLEFQEEFAKIGAKDCLDIGLPQLDEETGWCVMVMGGMRMSILQTEIAKNKFDKLFNDGATFMKNMDPANPDMKKLQEFQEASLKLTEETFFNKKNQKKLDQIILGKINKAKAACKDREGDQARCVYGILGQEHSSKIIQMEKANMAKMKERK